MDSSDVEESIGSIPRVNDNTNLTHEFNRMNQIASDVIKTLALMEIARSDLLEILKQQQAVSCSSLELAYAKTCAIFIV